MRVAHDRSYLKKYGRLFAEIVVGFFYLTDTSQNYHTDGTSKRLLSEFCYVRVQIKLSLS